jgi:hypothetical protein
MKSQKNLLKSFSKEALLSLVMLSVVVLPFFAFASKKSHAKDVYVNISANEKNADGTMEHPYASISKALEKAKDNTNVHVAKGIYKERITIPSGVKVFGSGEKEVFIKSDSNNNAAVTMKNDTEINKVTIKGGHNGILVKEDTKVSIVDCVVSDANSDGIKIESGKVSDSKKVSISKTTISGSGKSGIFSEKRRLILIDNEIKNNNKEGVDISRGSSVWMEKNEIKDNDGSGVKLVLDGSYIWTKSNTINNNKKQGFEINSYGQSGKIDINKSKITKNGKFGIARNQRISAPIGVWNGLTINQKNSTISGNDSGSISGVARLF